MSFTQQKRSEENELETASVFTLFKFFLKDRLATQRKKLENSSRQTTMKIKPYKIYRMQKKQSVLRENRYITLLNKQEKSQMNNLTYHLNELEKEEQTKSKVSKRKEIIKTR